MKRIILLLTLISLPALAAEKKKYNTHFTNPVVDSRFNFVTCAVSGALYGILENKMGNVLCAGSLISDKAKSPKIYYVYKAENRSTLSYFEVTERKDLGGVGEQGGGYMDSVDRVRAVTKDLEVSKPLRVSTFRFHTEWDYSEGSTMLRGRLPGSKVEFSAPVFGLGSIDDDLEQFAGEIGN